MKSQAQLPDPETIQRTVDKWSAVCQKLDALNLLLDKADIRHSRSTSHRLDKIDRPLL